MLNRARLLGCCAALCAVSLPATAQDDPKAHFGYVGPLVQLLPEGKSPGAVTSGIPFDVVLTDGGKTVASGPYDLKITGVDKPLQLTLSGAKFEGGRLTAQAKVQNGTGAAVEGVRLDITSATETYKTKDAQGKEVEKTREQKVAIASPLFFGDIADGADNGELAVDAGPLTFAPETTRIAVHGQVSGLRYMATFKLDNVSVGEEIDVDSKGRIYLASYRGNQVARIDNDGKNQTVAVKLPDQCKGMAVNRKTGDIAANCGNHHEIFIFTASGDDKATFGTSPGLRGYPGTQRYDSSGNLWSNLDSILYKFGADGIPVLKIEKAGAYDLRAQDGFDIAPDGTIYAITEKTLFAISPDGKTARRIATGPGYKLGQLENPSSCRVDAQGNVYVTEVGGNNGSDASRISVFDRAGRFVRAFGRGAKTAAPGFPDKYYAAQVFNPGDVAFGPDGRVYVSTDWKGADGGQVIVYLPF